MACDGISFSIERGHRLNIMSTPITLPSGKISNIRVELNAASLQMIKIEGPGFHKEYGPDLGNKPNFVNETLNPLAAQTPVTVTNLHKHGGEPNFSENRQRLNTYEDPEPPTGVLKIVNRIESEDAGDNDFNDAVVIFTWKKL